jgi:uncharacterized repeat protein (TIGR02543 family)
LFASCKEPNNAPVDDEYKNPNAVAARELTLSHNSGLYNTQISLTLTTANGNEIYYSIDGSIPSKQKVDNKRVFKYSSPITVKNRNGEKNLLATPTNSTNMYGYENDPRGSMPAIYIPTDSQVPKATVIRAIAVGSNGKKGGVVTKTFFIGNNVANSNGERVISLVSDPYNLVDEKYGIMVRGNPSNRWDSEPPYNFRRKGADWEREAYLELFDEQRNVPLSTGVGIRVRGGWSRASGQKSFTVYFKEQYGINNLKNYELIPGAVKADGKTPVATYKSVMLRNGANDCDQTKFYDVFLQDLVSDRSFSAQASVPCVVYLNGEYWGPYNLQERYSDNHTEYKYGVKKENVISYDNGELDDGTPADESLYWQMMNMRFNDMSVQANYDAFCAAFDIQNFIDYWAAQIYIYNEDWPQNNYRLWRVRNAEPGNPYGDQKWRWQMFDTEFAIGIYNGGGLTSNGTDAFGQILYGPSKDHHNNQLFNALLKNSDFCKQFVNTMMDLYNVNFHPDSFNPKLDKYAAAYGPLMEGYFERFGRPWGHGVFENKTNDARKYLTNIRNAMVNYYLPTYFSNIGVTSGNLCNVTVSTTGVSNASVKINTTPNFTGSWTGKYYSAIPVTVTASAPPSGYEFNGWTVTGGTTVSPLSNTSITVNLTGDAQITAKYKPVGQSIVPVTGITLDKTSLNLKIGETSNLSATVTPSGATYKTVLWKSDNASVASVDNGKVTAIDGGTATITASTVEGIYATCTVIVKPRDVLLDLSQVLKSLTPQVIDTWDKFDNAFNDLPLRAPGNIESYPYPEVTYEIIEKGGVKQLQVNNFALWAPGLDIMDFGFHVGDRIDIKGTYKKGPGNGIYLNTQNYDPWWAPLQGWEQWCSDGQSFQKEFILSEYDVHMINLNVANAWGTAIRISTGGIEPWSGTNPNGISTFIIEQFKVSGYRD